MSENTVDLVLKADNQVSQGADAAGDSLGQLAQEAQQLDKELAQLQEAGAAGEQFDALRESVSGLAQELGNAQGVQQAISNFRELKTETADAEKEWQSATEKVRELAQELAGTEAPSKAMQRDFERAKKAAAQSKESFEEKRQSLQELRTELSRSGINTKDLSSAQQQLTQNTAQLKTELDDAKRNLGEMGREATQAGEGFSDLQKMIGLAAGALAALGAKQQFDAVVVEQEQLQRNLLRTEQIIRSSGRAASISAEELHQQARELALATLGSTEGVMEAQQLLLGLQNVGVDSFGSILELASDYASVMGGDVVSATRLLGRAFDDPANAAQTLGRILTREQRDSVAAIAETNGAVAAQARLMELLSDRIGGTARAEALGLAGAQDTLGQSIQEARIAIADYVDAGAKLSDFYNSIAEEIFVFNGALAAGEYDRVIAAVKAITAALATAGALYITAAKGAAALAAAKGVYTAATLKATAATNAFTAAIARNPLGAIAVAVATAAAGYAAYTASMRSATESAEELADANELLRQSLDDLSETQAEAALMNIQAAQSQLVAEIYAAQAEIEQLEQRNQELAARGEELSFRDQRRLANQRAALEQLHDQYYRLERRTDEINQRFGENAQAADAAAQATQRLSDATTDLADAVALSDDELAAMLDSLGTNLEELEYGISQAEQRAIQAFMHIEASGRLSAEAMQRLARTTAASLRSEEARELFSNLGEAAAAAIEQASSSADRAAQRAETRIGRLGQAVSSMLSDAERNRLELLDAADAARTVEDIEAVRSAVYRLSSQHHAEYMAGQRSAAERINSYEVMARLNERQQALSQNQQQTTEETTRSIQNQRREVESLAEAIQSIPARTERAVQLVLDRSALDQLQGQLNANPIEAKVRLVVDAQELAQLRQAVAQAVRQSASSVAQEINRELRRRG